MFIVLFYQLYFNFLFFKVFITLNISAHMLLFSFKRKFQTFFSIIRAYFLSISSENLHLARLLTHFSISYFIYFCACKKLGSHARRSYSSSLLLVLLIFFKIVFGFTPGKCVGVCTDFRMDH